MARATRSKGIPYDVSGVDSAGGDFNMPPQGLYRARVTDVVDEKPPGKDRRLHVTLTLTHDSKGKSVKKENYSQLHRYYNLESEAAKGFLRQFLEAVGVVKNKRSEKGSLDPADMTGKDIMVRVRHEDWKEEDG